MPLSKYRKNSKHELMLEVRAAMAKLNVNLPEQTYHLIMQIENPAVAASLLLKLMEFTNPKMRAVEVNITQEQQPMSLDRAREIIMNDPGSKTEEIEVIVEPLEED